MTKTTDKKNPKNTYRFTLPNGVRSSFCTIWTCLIFQMVLPNVFSHHNRILMGGTFRTFRWPEMIEFVDDLPFFEYFRKIIFTTSLRKARKGRDSGTSEELHRSFRETGTTTIFSLGYQYCAWPCSAPFCWQKPFFDFNSEFIWLFFLNILSFNFILIPNKSLRFRRFRRN